MGRPRLRDGRPRRRTARIELLGRDVEAELRRARDQDVRRAARRRRGRARPTCSSGELARRRRLAAAAAASATSGAGTCDKPWDAPGWLPARVPGSVARRPRARGRGARPVLRAEQPLAEWVPERGPGSTARARRRRPATIRLRGRRPRGDGLRRRRGGRAPRRARSRRSRSRSPPGEHLLAVAVHAGAGERAAGRADEPRPRAQEPHGLRLGLLPAPRPPGDLAAGDARRRRRSVVPARDARGRRRHASRSTASVVLRGRAARSSGGRTGSASSGCTRVAGARHRGRLPHGRAAPNEGARGRAAVRFVVNGVPMPISGWNWVPLDALYGVPRPEKLAHLLGLARAREREPAARLGRRPDRDAEFYELCDRLGMLVWQEFVAVELRHRERPVATTRRSSS